MNPTQFLAHFDGLADAPNAISRLRRFILDLAVRGKLVAQDSNDAPASEFIEERTFVPDSEPWPLPSGWEWSSLSRLGETLGGGTPSKSEPEYWNGSIPWVSPKDMKVDWINDAEDHISEAAITHSSAKLIPKGSLLMVVRGMILAHSYPTAISTVPLAINQDMKAIVPFRSDFARMLLLLTKGMKPEVMRLVLRSTHGTCKLLTDDLFSLPFPVPPLAEQKRIVAKVDELMALCDRLETAQTERENRRDRLVRASLHRLNQPADGQTFRAHARFTLDNLPCLTTRLEHMPQLRQTILNLAFRGALVPQDSCEGTGQELLKQVRAFHPESREFGGNRRKKEMTFEPMNCPGLFEIPSNWSWSYLDFLCEQIADVDHNMPKAVDKGVPFISAKDLKDDGTLDFNNPKMISEADFERLSRKVKIRRNDIIYSRIGARLGKARLVEVDTRFLISYSCCLVRPLHEFVEKRYLQKFLDSKVALSQAHGGTQSIGVPDLGLGEIKAFRVPLPPIAEQRRIVAKVDELMALCNRLEAQLTTTQTESRRLLEAVLHEALYSNTGR
jgi:type I restriction enzyme S subunit